VSGKTEVNSISEMHDLGARISKELAAGDLLLLSGPLGAGKTALVQGIGRALGIENITSPTFVISRIHPGKIP
jgi:tRNA threonylcarbamoyladenosine biosynthesis protein TsaE